MARRIQSSGDLKDALDQAEVDSAQELMNHDAFVVWQWWAKDTRSEPPELYGPETGGMFTSFDQALTARDELHTEALGATGWIEMFGEPTTEIVPVWRKGT